MRENEVEFYSPAESPDEEVLLEDAVDDPERGQCVEESDDIQNEEPPMSFRSLVCKFRDLHPGSRIPNDQPLDSKNKIWRQECMKLTGMSITDKTKFGGQYKQHLVVSTLSERCFQVCLSIMTSYSTGQLLNQKTRTVNRMLFAEIGGIRSEDVLHQELLQLRDGRRSKDQFNKRLRKIKEEQRKHGDSELTILEENRRLKMELEKKETTIKQQAAEIKDLKTRLESLQAERETVSLSRHSEEEQIYQNTDVFNFSTESSDSESNSEAVEVDTPLDTDTAFSTTSPKSVTVTSRVGKVMEALDNGIWYEVKILKESAGGAMVHWQRYNSVFDSHVKNEDLREIQLKFKIGDNVRARYRPTLPTLYRGQVVATDGNYVRIHFEDESATNIHHRYVQHM